MITRRGGAWLAAFSVAAGSAAVLFRFDPMRVDFYPRCPLYVLTGLYCPGCGALRAGHALLHGEVMAALGFNVLFVLALPVFAYLAASRLRGAVTGRPLPTRFLPAAGIWAILGVLIGFSVLRNLPFEPFVILAP
jgi:hypothetical protein